MKKALFVVCAALAGASAWADIPSPTKDQLTVSGSEAAEVAALIPGDYKVVTEGFNTTKQKVLRTSKGLTQIVCTRVEGPGSRVRSETCEIQKSANGVELDAVGGRRVGGARQD